VTAAATVIPAQTRIEGRIETQGDLVIEGRCDGELAVDGTLTVAAGASCHAAIRARVALIRGEVIGGVVCSEAIDVGAGARVVGDLRAPDIAVDGAARVEGRVDLLAPAPRGSTSRRVPIAVRGPTARIAVVADPSNGGAEPATTGARPIPQPPRPRGKSRVTTRSP
jgi:cytoskeletal protein CcmA (bactofilin family)